MYGGDGIWIGAAIKQGNGHSFTFYHFFLKKIQSHLFEIAVYSIRERYRCHLLGMI